MINTTTIQRQGVERTLAIRELREDWRLLAKAVKAGRPEAVLWRLRRVQQTRGMHGITAAEMLVASGAVR